MSSTNRGSQRSPADNYATPSWCTRRLLEHYPGLPEGNWLEPCAGAGDIIQVAKTFCGNRKWTAVELRDECEPALKKLVKTVHCPQDFLEWETKKRFDVAITNPPFRLAQQILEKCLEIADHVVFLLRLNYVGSEKRHAFMSSRMANHTLVLPNRPPFTYSAKGKWGTDSIEYAWFHWDSHNPTSESILRMLPLTPLEERKKR